MELTMAKLHRLERALIASALVMLTLMAWGYLVAGAFHGPMDGSMAVTGTLDLLGLNVVMWTIMMVSLMLPSASPMILTYLRVYRQRGARGRATVSVWPFITGYLLVWTGYAVIAAIAQWALYDSAQFSSAMGKVDPLLGGGLLVVAGAFQFSRLKEACMKKCRSPVGFLMTEWREGNPGALVMGIRHGAYCAGCCWALMLLMFVGGVMSLAWMAALAVYFLAEKLFAGALYMGKVTGALLIIAGVTLSLTSAFASG